MKLFFKDIQKCLNQLIDKDCKRNLKHIKTQFEHMKLVFKEIISVFNELIAKRTRSKHLVK